MDRAAGVHERQSCGGFGGGGSSRRDAMPPYFGGLRWSWMAAMVAELGAGAAYHPHRCRDERMRRIGPWLLPIGDDTSI